MRMLCFLFCLVLSIPLLMAEEGNAHYQLIAPKEMDEQIVTRVQEWMTKNLHYPVKVERKEAWEVGTGEAQLKAVLGEKREGVIVTVVLSAALEPAEQHAFVDPEQKAGVIHVGRLVPLIEEKTLRRLDRQAMRIAGFSLGLSPQPIPFCCLYPYRSLSELDAIGRGFSPPAQALYRKQLEKQGIPLSKAAKERLPNVNNIQMPKPPPPVQKPAE